MLFLVCPTEFLHVHVCVWMSAALWLTQCWDIWEIKYESCYCARACALPAGTVCAFERREICYRRRTEELKKRPEFVSSWNAKQLFFHLWVFAHAAPRCCCLADGLLRVGVGGYPIPVPHHCGQTEIYAHCRKQASIHWLQLLQKSGSLLPQQIRWSEQQDQLRDRSVIWKP